jgi:hypothetical protein
MLYGMNEYLMIAHEMEKARLLARQAKKSSHKEEPSLTVSLQPTTVECIRQQTRER